MTATSGDFLLLADQHITASLTRPGRPSVLDVRAILGELTRLVKIMDRHTYPDPAAQATMLVTGDSSTADRAIFAVAIGLSRAAHFMSLASPAVAERQSRSRDPIARHLHAAGDSLIAARDLMQTHFDAESGEALAGSGWAPVITTRPVSFALAYEMSKNAHLLGPLTNRLLTLAARDAGIPTTGLHALRSASYWLDIAGTSMAANDSMRCPVRAKQTLYAIPANVVPPRHPPAPTGSVLELCLGVSVTTDRLRHLAHPATQGLLEPAKTSTSWRRVAHGAAIVTHNCELILRALGPRCEQLGVPPTLGTELSQAADAAERTWISWRTAARSWDILTTGTSRELSPLAAELTDLVVWVGRIARDNPAWTPARSDASQPRDPASLAPDERHLSAVLLAMLRAAAVIADMARQDAQAVKLITDQQGLYIPTRLAPETQTTARTFRYSKAPQSYVDAVLDAYKTATRHSKAMVKTLSRAMVTTRQVDAASAPELAAALKESNRVELWRQTHRKPAPPSAIDEHPDRLERVLDQLRIEDPALRTRAIAIDYATQDLKAQAEATARKRHQANKEVLQTRAQPTPPSPRAQSARTASQDQRLTERVPPVTSGGPAVARRRTTSERSYSADGSRPTTKPDRSRSTTSTVR